MTISEIADKAFVSTATVSRAIKKCGIDNLHVVRYQISVKQIAKDNFVAHDILENTYSECKKTIERIDTTAVLKFVGYIRSAKKIIILSQGGTTIAAEELETHLRWLGFMAYKEMDPMVMRRMHCQVKEGDLVVILSVANSNPELLSKANDFKGKTVKLANDIALNSGDASTWSKTAPETEWMSIGTVDTRFAGTFDGQMHTISGVYMNTDEKYVVCGKVEKYMIPDREEKQIGRKIVESKLPTWKLFGASGFLFLVVVAATRTMVENGVKTISATMLMESYEHISPSLGNILNTLIIISGVIGVALINQFIYPRLIRDEAVATLVLVGVSMIPILVMTLLGKAPVFLIVTSLCIAAAILSGINLIMSRCSASFVKYGKSGLASGVANSAASVAIMIQSYGTAYVADNAGWKMVVWLFIVLLSVGVLCTGIAIPLWNRFKKNKIC